MTKLLIALTLALGAREAPAKTSHSAVVPGESKAPQEQELAAPVRALFAAKCVECHGDRLARPKGKFGYVVDLKRVAANPKLVVPFRPDQSRLWRMLRDNEMPPEGLRAVPLTPRQKEAVRAWIAAGALPPSPGHDFPAPGLDAPADAGEAAALPGPSLLTHLLGWLGRFHVLLVHFPIALLVVAAVGEGWSWWLGLRIPAPAVRFCLLLGAAGAVAGAVLGWLEAAFGGYAAASRALDLHRWVGTTTAVVAIGVALLSEADARRGARSPLCRSALFLAALLVSAAGHLGGTLVHGTGHFDW
jgi:hypothetical protein